MVVDDSRLQRRIVSSLLSSWGYSVVEATSGAEALELCKQDPPDLIISDWMMPEMDGLEFCKQFRALPSERYVYFVLLTSKNEKVHAAEGLDAGADDFLTKPVNKAELRARINAGERILDMQQQLTEKNGIIRQTLNKLEAAHERIDNDLMEARKLQQSLVREREGVFGNTHISLVLHPAGRVGGDLVGFYPISEFEVGCFAIDVSGHGISSALMTARLAGYLSSTAPAQNVALEDLGGGLYAGRPPGAVVQHLNELIMGEVATELYFTMVLAHIELSSGAVRMAQAGHPHPMIQRADGQVEEVGRGGVPVGLLTGMEFEETTFVLEPGDRLLIHSDGIIECHEPGGAMLGMEGLTEMLSELGDTQGPALLEALMWRLDAFAEIGEFPDDVSAVLVEVRKPGEEEF